VVLVLASPSSSKENPRPTARLFPYAGPNGMGMAMEGAW
jgi:hypothetical protein